MLIGKLAAESGFSRDTIRYYEKIGLLQLGQGDRRANNYKDYSLQVLERLGQIRQLKELGFTLAEIGGLLQALDGEPCAGLPERLDEKIGLIGEKIALLEQYRSKLTAVRAACDGACGSALGLPDCVAAHCC